MSANLARKAAAIAAAATLVTASLIGWASPAVAAATEVTTAAELEAAIADANAAPELSAIVVAANITDADLFLDVTSPLRIDVGGYTVDSVRLRATADLWLAGPGRWVAGRSSEPDLVAAPGIGVGPQATATIDGLSLEARGTRCDAGIGGWNAGFLNGCNSGAAVGGGSVVIADSTVTAVGYYAAAIGSDHGSKTSISISNSTVTASSNSGAAIGASDFGYADSPRGDSGPITIVDSTVNARTGQHPSAAIGGGVFGNADDISISGSSVFTRDSSGVGAIGNGGEASGGAGVLRLGTSTIDSGGITLPATVDAGATLSVSPRAWLFFRYGLTNNGTVIIGADARLNAGDAVVNHGIIRPAANVGANVEVTGTAFGVHFAPNDGTAAGGYTQRVYAPTLAAAHERVFPAYGVGRVFTSWNTATDGGGARFLAETELAALADADGQVSLFAQWIDDYVALAPEAQTVVAGSRLLFTSTVPVAGGGTEDVSDWAELTSSEPSDVVDGSGVTATTAGVRTVATAYNGMTAAATVTVLPDALARLTATPSARTAAPGGSLSLAVSGADRFANVVPVDPASVSVTSSVAADVVTGVEVRLVGEGPRTLTATVGSVTASVDVIAVAPTAPAADPRATPGAVPAQQPPLVESGGSPAAVAVAAALLAGGAAMLGLRRRARS